MRRVFLIVSFIILLYFTIGFYFATYQIQIFSSKEPNKHPIYHDYRGVTHVVTSHSKGSSLPKDILLEASLAELDFLIFTDLNPIDRPYNISGYQGDVFTLSNQKISYVDAHILIYSPNPDFYFDSMSTANAQLHQHFFEPAGAEKNFVAVLAHPFKLNHSWTGDYPEGLDGIEVVNMRHLWQQIWFNDRLDFIWSIFIYPFNPQIALTRLIREPKSELELWDQLNKKRHTLGLLGNETTAKIFKIFGLNFTFPSYEKSFRFGSNHLLLESELTGYVESDRKKIFNSFRKGQFYFSFDSLGDPSGFAAYVQNAENRFPMGSQVSMTTGLDLHVDLPASIAIPFVVEVYRNGGLHYRSDITETTMPIKEPGQYRVVVKVQPQLPLPDNKKWLSWIYSNTFYID